MKEVTIMTTRVGANMIHKTSAIKIFGSRKDLISNGLKGATASKGVLNMENIEAFRE